MRRIRPMLVLGLEEFDVEWAHGLPRGYAQTDAAFYKDPATSLVCTIKKDGFEVDIYCEGEMRALLDGDRKYGVATCADELFRGFGVKTDDDLKRVEWEMNPWFDLYVRGEHLDEVSHDIRDAVASAKAYLEETIANARQIEEGILSLE